MSARENDAECETEQGTRVARLDTEANFHLSATRSDFNETTKSSSASSSVCVCQCLMWYYSAIVGSVSP